MQRPTRKTKQKALIKEILIGTDMHPTADWVYEQARKNMPNISLGTIYRNLKTMVDSGEILELEYGGYSRFDGNPLPHYHFRCERCNKIYDIALKHQEQLNNNLSEQGFKVQGHRLELFGICPECS